MNILTVLFVALGALACIYVIRWAAALYRSRLLPRDACARVAAPRPIHIVIGFVTSFFDALGIGAFATTASAFKLLGLVRDELIPGTMIVGHSLSVITMAFVFISVVTVDRTVLITLVLAAVAGGWLGAGIVSRLPRRPIQLGMAIALVLAALFMTMGLLGWFPAGGAAITLTPGRLAFALIVNFVLGALVTLGIGNYGPSLVLFSLLGMDPHAAFPIMMGSGAFLAMVAAMRFVNRQSYDARAALGLTLGGIPGVFIAVWLVKSLPLDVIRWVVIIVVLYTAMMLVRSSTPK
jgi:uncharacterized membrane protein YfcA